MEKKLQVRHLRISFRTTAGKVQAVRDISFDLHKGETMAIVGESGSGKSVTSKAILGILAGNAIVEGGEILYDGQDLLKIGEDDFYRLRGDKIAMIFQDPLSSLNPIMRIGKQLTEAMILKGRARQKSSKAEFHAKLDLLEKYMCEANPSAAGQIREACALFRQFEMRHTRLELAYNEALEAAQEAQEEIENVLFLIEKNALKDAATRLKEIRDFARKTENPYVVSARFGELKSLADGLTSGLRAQARQNYAPAAQKLKRMQAILAEAIALEKPDFFALGFAQEKNAPQAPQGDVAAKNAYYERYLNENFLDEFLRLAENGLAWSDKKHMALREKAIAMLDKGIAALKLEDCEAAMAAFKPLVGDISKAVDESIEPLDVVKDSAACTFSGSLKAFMAARADGERNNARKIAKYERQMRRYNRLVERGRQPDWKVAAATTVDFELNRSNILSLLNNLRAHYVVKNEEAPGEDRRAKAEQLIEYIKDCASGMVYKITKRAARNRALKLMDEVGIPEPRKRYRQYPFEFSGGMRQRIVIAIALAANPDILICDEPTTALDVTIQAQILELINRLKEKRKLSIIFITHDLGVVANMADRIAVMYAGQIVEYGTAEEVFYSPAHPYTWALLSSMPDLETRERLEAIPGTPPNMIYPPKGDAFAERNRYAMKIDFERQPPAFPITETHWAATWLLHPDAPKVDPPKIVTDRIAKMRAKMRGNANA